MMATVSGSLSVVTEAAAFVSGVWVQAPSLRTRGGGVILPQRAPATLTGSTVTFPCAPGPAVLVWQAGGVEDHVPILVDDVPSQTLAEVVEAAALAEGRTQDELAALVAQVIAAAQATAADRVQAGKDRAQTGQDRAATGADRTAVAADRVQTGKDRTATAADRVQTGKDRADAEGFASAASSSAASARADALLVEGAASDVSWADDRLTVMGKTSPSLRGPKGNQGEPGKDGTGAGDVTTEQLTTALSGKADLVGGVVPTSQIPAVALTKPFTAVSLTAMLALDAQEGDVAVITGGEWKGTYMLGAGPSHVASSWVRLSGPDAPVQSVNGQSGTVVLGAADVGAAPVSHTHTMSQIRDLPQVTTAAFSGAIVKRGGGGEILVPLVPVSVGEAASADYVNTQIDARTPRVMVVDTIPNPPNPTTVYILRG